VPINVTGGTRFLKTRFVVMPIMFFSVLDYGHLQYVIVFTV